MLMRIVHVTIQSVEASLFRGPAEEVCRENGWDLELFCANNGDIDDDPLVYRELVERSKEADLVLVRVMADPTRMLRFERWEKVLRECPGYVYVYSGNLDAALAYRDLFKGDDGEYLRLREYVRDKGAENDRAVVLWLHRMLTGEGELPDPVKQRPNGLYHPDYDRDVTLREYLPRLDPSKPTIGLLFTSNLWVYGNLAHIDALIREVEAQGMNIIPVFFSAVTSRSEDTIGTASVVKDYFMDGDMVMIDALIMSTPFSQLNSSRDCSGVYTPDEQNFFSTMLKVPVFQAMSVASHFGDYEETAEGLSRADLGMSVIWPEVDGQIITVPFASNEQGRGAPKRYDPLPDRITHLVKTVGGWARLARKPASDRRIAILVYQTRPESGRIGGAAGLDTIESVRDMLDRLRADGYTVDHVPDTSRDLVDEFLDNITNDLEWSSDERIREKAADMIPAKKYAEWYSEVPEFNRKRMEDSWGKAPGEVAVIRNELVVPGIVNGNIYVGYQPLRSWADQMEAVYHDPVIPMPHQYLAFYRWLRDDFRADAVIHVGTHGTLEWLPGRSLGLSRKCFPDIVLDGIPHIYPYVIDDPGEGIQAKRRSEAVLIGHMCPTMARAGSYDELESIDGPMQELFKNTSAKGEQRKAMVSEVLEAARKADILGDLEIPQDVTPEDFEKELGRIHDYITDLKDAIIRDGLHVFGKAPEGDLLAESVYSLTRVRNGDIPSLRSAVAGAMGIDLDSIVEGPSGTTGGEVNAVLLERADSATMTLIQDMQAAGYDPEACAGIARRIGESDDLDRTVAYICTRLVPNLARMTDEMDNMLLACSGRYVLPGPSGAPTRGNADILPMGRNFYGIDPDIVPTKAAWGIGRRMADQMVAKYTEAKGCYPTEVGFIIWATDTMKTNGDDVAYILWLMGARPVWSPSGQVTGVEPVPLEELGRPRIDVTVRITGLFRDAFPNLIALIDDAVKMVSSLDEADEDNALASNLRRDIVDAMAGGLTVDEARRRASVRVFGCPPGSYGPGVNHAIESGDWKTVQDLADIYTAWGSCAYGRNEHGEAMKDEFVRRFSKVKATVKNMPDREIDLLDIDDVYGYLGGMNSFVRAYGKEEAMSFMGDGSDPDRVRTRGTKEELQFVYRSKVLNPKFVEGLKRHGYRGVSEIANLTEFTFGWDATSDIVDDWIYEKLTETYLFDDDTREWMQDENPHAMMEMMDRLFEAVERGMWDVKPETLERMKDIYLGLEERVEEIRDR
ncbi:MAG: cobaltochelatase subunit CobN [Thermoplasmata archaeon]|nr:cobaltochelatase subunit CobN [Thermoplasmata archaeon]